MADAQKIYISFNHQVTQKDVGEERWVSEFIENMQIAMPRVLKMQPVYLIKGREFGDETYHDAIEQANVFLLFIDEEFLDSETYLEEIHHIVKHLDIESESNLGGISRIFKITRTEFEATKLPTPLVPVFTYEFFELNMYTRKVVSYNFYDELSILAWSKLLDLVYDMNDAMKALSDSSNRLKYVYLGENSLDQKRNHDDIRRELQHFGYRVLPITTVPDTAEEMEKMIYANLEHSGFVVQLMGARYGNLIRGSKYSIPDFQNRIIKKYQDEHPEKDIYRIIWIPAGTKITDQRQNLYLKRLVRDEASVNTEIIEAPLEVFKTVLHNRLENHRSLRPSQIRRNSVYLIYEECMAENVEPYRKILEKSGFNIFELDYNLQAILFSQHLDFLKEADYVVIFAHDCEPYWLRSKLRDLIKAPGIGRQGRFDRIGVITNHRVEIKDIELLRNDMEFIEADLDSFGKFVKKL